MKLAWKIAVRFLKSSKGQTTLIALGLALLLMFSKFALNADGTPIADVYIDINFITLSITVAILASTIAALIPARNSSKLSPMEVIRNG